ncbi:hypothetical protein C8R43DRAFT_1141452 [Mycena crocata]|nr:hypothetical protein C8R43DRAFT_1141452 [Mycena crocata]
MSSSESPRRWGDPLTADELKRQRHAEAQARYRARKIDETRAQARERMADLRARKFRNKFGQDAFMDFYYPQYKLLGLRHLPGLYFGPEEQAELKE